MHNTAKQLHQNKVHQNNQFAGVLGFFVTEENTDDIVHAFFLVELKLTVHPALFYTLVPCLVENMNAFLSRIGEKQTSILRDSDKLR